MKFLSFLFLFATLFAQAGVASQKPELLLLNKYSDDKNVTGWMMSEKLDGVRAYWDGEKLVSRNGTIFSPPAFFTKDFPKTKLDGELWSERGDFSNISSIVNTRKLDSRVIPDSDRESRWHTLTYNVFEVPNAAGNLLQRLSIVKESRYIKLVKQTMIKDKTDLDRFLKSVEQKGGEGVVVRDGSLDYYASRNDNALKVKSYVDEECVVAGYSKGKGKYENMTGALLCETQNKKTIKLGTGLSDEQRKNPPKIGAIITFKYYGLTSKGNPRFPVFLRERE